MKTFLSSIKTSVIALLLLTLLLGILYPFLMFGVGKVFFHKKAAGSLLYKEGELIGSSLIGQHFSSPKYFHSRPSNAGYDAANSSASNLGPTSQTLINEVQERITTYKAVNGRAAIKEIPADAVTSSASGLDPHIGIPNAMIQARRISDIRDLPFEKIEHLIKEHTEKPTLGIMGEKRVNVLLLNMALDEL